MSIWLTMLLAGLITYGLRLSFIAFYERIRMPEIIHRALRYVPPAVLSAIIFPEVLFPGGEPGFTLENPRLMAGIVAGFVAWITRNVLLTIASGMLVLLLLQNLL